MHGIVAGAVEQIRNERRERVVDKEPHLSAQPPTSGNSRSRTASAA
jgi:hypothetical protein